MTANLSEVGVDGVIAFARAYVNVGWAVQEQIDGLLDHEFDGLNASAVAVIKRNLAAYHEDIREAVDAYEAWYEKEHRRADSS